MEKLDFKKDFLDYDWLKKGNVNIRCQNNRTIMNSYLKGRLHRILLIFYNILQ